MTRSKMFTTLLLFAVGVAGAGCATSAGAPRDLRSSARLTRTAPSLLVAGPALLMHVDVDDPDDQLVLYAVARKDGSDADCGAGPTGGSVRLHARRPNPVNLVVPADQAACVSASNARASIRWHARRPASGVAADEVQMLALGARDR